jgi:molybdopterin-guanine dinucleotide biosynthesis protein A
MHCLILAGGNVRPEDPLYPYTNGRPKALIDMGDRKMLERVIEALQSAEQVEDILVVGIDPELAAQQIIPFSRPVHFLPDQGGMVANMLAGAAWFRRHLPQVEIVLGCSADIPAITGPIVERFIDACRPWDKAVYYSFVERDTLESRFPLSRRTYSRISGREVAGGDMVIARVEVVERNQELIESLTGARKKPWQIAGVVGLRMLLKFLFGRVKFEDIEETASRILGMPAAAILFDRAEIAMDADKPHQVELLRSDFIRS